MDTNGISACFSFRLRQAVDRRADDRLAQPLSSVGQGLGMLQPERPRIPTLEFHPLDGAKALSGNKLISDGLLGFLCGEQRLDLFCCCHALG